MDHSTVIKIAGAILLGLVSPAFNVGAGLKSREEARMSKDELDRTSARHSQGIELAI